MARVKRGFKARRRRNRMLKAAQGYRGRRSTLYKTAKMAVFKGWIYAYRDRKQKKRDFRSLWIVRINAGARANGLSYSRLVAGLRAAGVEVDRKMLAALALDDPKAFAEIAGIARAQAPATA